MNRLFSDGLVKNQVYQDLEHGHRSSVLSNPVSSGNSPHFVYTRSFSYFSPQNKFTKFYKHHKRLLFTHKLILRSFLNRNSHINPASVTQPDSKLDLSFIDMSLQSRLSMFSRDLSPAMPILSFYNTMLSRGNTSSILASTNPSHDPTTTPDKPIKPPQKPDTSIFSSLNRHVSRFLGSRQSQNDTTPIKNTNDLLSSSSSDSSTNTHHIDTCHHTFASPDGVIPNPHHQFLDSILDLNRYLVMRQREHDRAHRIAQGLPLDDSNHTTSTETTSDPRDYIGYGTVKSRPRPSSSSWALESVMDNIQSTSISSSYKQDNIDNSDNILQSTTNTPPPQQQRHPQPQHQPLPALNRLDSSHFDSPSFLLFSGVGLLFVRVFLYPLNVVKTHLQTTSTRPVPQFIPPALSTVQHEGMKRTATVVSAPPSSLSVMRQIVSTSGVSGLFAGLNLSLILTVSRQLYFYMYEEIRRCITQANERYHYLPSETLDPIKDSLAAFSASAIYQVLANPLDVIVQRLMVHKRALQNVSSSSTLPDEAAKAFDPFAVPEAPLSRLRIVNILSEKSDSFRLTRNLVIADGVASMYRGFLSSCILFSLSAAVWWGSFEIILTRLGKYVAPPSSSSDGDDNNPKIRRHGDGFLDQWLSPQVSQLLHTHPWPAQHIAAASSSFLSVLMTHPLDVCRTRLMVNARRGDGLTATIALKQLIRDEGWRALFVGVYPRSLSVIPTSVLTMAIYQVSKVMAVEVKLRREEQQQQQHDTNYNTSSMIGSNQRPPHDTLYHPDSGHTPLSYLGRPLAQPSSQHVVDRLKYVAPSSSSSSSSNNTSIARDGNNNNHIDNDDEGGGGLTSRTMSQSTSEIDRILRHYLQYEKHNMHKKQLLQENTPIDQRQSLMPSSSSSYEQYQADMADLEKNVKHLAQLILDDHARLSHVLELYQILQDSEKHRMLSVNHPSLLSSLETSLSLYHDNNNIDGIIIHDDDHTTNTSVTATTTTTAAAAAVVPVANDTVVSLTPRQELFDDGSDSKQDEDEHKQQSFQESSSILMAPFHAISSIFTTIFG